MKILLVIYILTIALFNISSSFADDNTPPPLPPLPSIEISESVNIETTNPDISFFEKTKRFFGLGQKNSTPNTKEEKTDVIKSELNDDIHLVKNQNSSNHVNQLVESDSNIKDNLNIDNIIQPNSEINNNIPQADNIVTIDDLKIPDGFEEFNDNQTLKNVENQTKLDAIEQQNITSSEPKINLLPIIPSEQLTETNIIHNQTDSGTNLESKKAIGSEPKVITITSNDNIPKTEQLNNISNNPPSNSILPSDSPVKKFQDQLNARANQKLKIARIPKEEIDTKNYSQEELNLIEKFVSNEAKVLILPNDDVILGELSDQSKLELMDFSNYITIFWENYNDFKESSNKKKIEHFIDNYGKIFVKNENKEPNFTDKSNILYEAAHSIKTNNIDRIRLFLNYSTILQLKNEHGNNLLNTAITNNNYAATKLLIVRGIDLKTRNNEGDSSFTLARKNQNPYMIYLLNSAIESK